VLEMIWVAPDLRVNGIIGGYTGPGAKNVLPAQASAKFTFPARRQAKSGPHREIFAPSSRKASGDCKVESFPMPQSCPQLPVTSEAAERARRGPPGEWGKEPVLIALGRIDPHRRRLQAEPQHGRLDDRFGLDDDRIHSPNEKYEGRSFHAAPVSWARVPPRSPCEGFGADRSAFFAVRARGQSRL